MRQVLVIGKSGQVSRALHDILEKNKNISVHFTSSKQIRSDFYLSLADSDSIRTCMDQWAAPKGSVIYLPGAFTNVEKCEVEQEECKKINTDGVIVVAEECRKRGYELCFFSTEYVFGLNEYHGGPIGPFSESDPVAPPCYYGECKAESEKRIKEILGEHALIIRTTMVFSWEKDGLNFLMQYVRHMKNWKEGERKFLVPTDQVSTPTYAPFLAETAVKLIEEGHRGIFHVVNKDLLSRWDVLRKVAAVFGFPEARVDEVFTPVKTKAMGQKAKRPLHAGLRVEKLMELNMVPPSLEDSLIAAKKIKNQEKK